MEKVYIDFKLQMSLLYVCATQIYHVRYLLSVYKPGTLLYEIYIILFIAAIILNDFQIQEKEMWME